ncbi:hypothetical protein [Alteromonas sp. D210916BOD_24]|uniref:hypothetical protein n=1 Tax=Alteromonas sp. D210916BOD_24 TaxID=3157618 RepID=UPI00399C516D
MSRTQWRFFTIATIPSTLVVVLFFTWKYHQHTDDSLFWAYIVIGACSTLACNGLIAYWCYKNRATIDKVCKKQLSH